jgi:hypothetical protein
VLTGQRDSSGGGMNLWAPVGKHLFQIASPAASACDNKAFRNEEPFVFCAVPGAMARSVRVALRFAQMSH